MSAEDAHHTSSETLPPSLSISQQDIQGLNARVDAMQARLLSTIEQAKAVSSFEVHASYVHTFRACCGLCHRIFLLPLLRTLVLAQVRQKQRISFSSGVASPHVTSPNPRSP
jgi:hypothetical protein